MTDHKTAEAVLKKYDRESNTVHYAGWPKKIVAAIAITFSVFQLYTATFGVLDAQLQRAIHLGFGLALAGTTSFIPSTSSLPSSARRHLPTSSSSTVNS